MTDIAELVRVLREQAKKNSAKIFLPVDVYPEWQAAAALESIQARADKLEAELAEAKRERDEARGIMPSKVWSEIFDAPAHFLTGHREHYYANYQIVREAHQRAKEQCPLAADVIMAQAFFQAVAREREETAWKEVLEERARADKLEAELVEAKNVAAMLRDNNRELVAMLDDANNRAKAAESSLAAAKERMSLVQRCIGARMDRMTPVQRECAVNAAWWLLNDMTGIRPATEKPEFVDREIAALSSTQARAGQQSLNHMKERHMQQIRAMVFEALKNAKDNGFDMRSWTPKQIIDDLKTFDADLEAMSDDQLRPHVEAWLKENPHV